MIIGFGFTKLSAEKNAQAKGNIDINNNVSIKDVQEDSFSMGKEKQNVLKFTFDFTSKYEPNVGTVLLEGELLYVEEPKKVKEILSSWKKDKKLDKELMATLLNTLLVKCNVQALILSQQINLPPPIPLPKVHMAAQQSDYIG
ncbi:MAG: hypothetical protein AABX32_01780 [Nanoarchaeota archaeon]